MIILFDLDNTLIDRDTAYFSWLKCYFESLHIDLNAEQWFEIRQRDNSGKGSRHSFFEWLIQRFKLTISCTDLMQLSFDEVHQYLPEISQAEKTLLQHLQKSHALGIVTNGGRKTQMNKLNSSGLLPYFEEDNIFISGVIGFEKPDPLYFEAVKKAMCQENEKVIIVGDDFDKDIVAGKKAGWRTAWLSKEVSNAIEVDYCIKHWIEIETIC